MTEYLFSYHENDVVLTQDRNTGTIHQRIRVGTRIATFEGCNLDASGAYSVIESMESAHEPSRLCHRCFPDEEDESDEPVPFALPDD